MDAISTAVVVFAAGSALYFVYLAATKGLPFAWSTVKSWWNAGKAELAKVQSDLTARVTTLEGDVAQIKKAIPLPAAAPAPQPAAANPAPVPAPGA